MNSIELVTNNKNGVNSTRTGYQWRFHDYCGFVSIILLLLSLNFVMWFGLVNLFENHVTRGH